MRGGVPHGAGGLFVRLGTGQADVTQHGVVQLGKALTLAMQAERPQNAGHQRRTGWHGAAWRGEKR